MAPVGVRQRRRRRRRLSVSSPVSTAVHRARTADPRDDMVAWAAASVACRCDQELRVFQFDPQCRGGPRSCGLRPPADVRGTRGPCRSVRLPGPGSIPHPAGVSAGPQQSDGMPCTSMVRIAVPTGQLVAVHRPRAQHFDVLLSNWAPRGCRGTTSPTAAATDFRRAGDGRRDGGVRAIEWSGVGARATPA